MAVEAIMDLDREVEIELVANGDEKRQILIGTLEDGPGIDIFAYVETSYTTYCIPWVRIHLIRQKKNAVPVVVVNPHEGV